MSHKVPEGKLARSGVAGAAAMKVGAGYLKHRVKRPFLSRDDKQKDKEKLDDKNAQVLFKALTQLRGTALKVAQMIGMEQGLLPESYRKELGKSFHQVPPLNRVLVRKLMMSEFNKTPEKLFAQFSAQAFAAASLGQVHKAKHCDGTNVAVKVQYPGINVAIESDLALLRGVVRGMSNSKLILQSLDEIEARLKEEVDYRIEAKNTRWFQKHVTLKGIYIPQVYNELSSQRVLTTELIQGLHLDNWLATRPSQAMRNKTAQLLYDFFIHSSRDLQRLHADPNPGNYLFHEDGSISVIDFGCVRRMSDQFTDLFPRILLAYLNDDPESLFAAYKELGMSCKDYSDSFYQKVLRPFGQWVTLPFQSDSFIFDKHFSYTQQGKQPMKNLHNFFAIDYVAEEFIFHNRTIYGLLQIFERMGATVRLRHHWVDL
ncbi:MAG: AarF/ABC1/UbiB kinase family protein [Gammaproteobacteria bacterium]|nr:AarF/ABC1/UbiB kinase family protein [Gammaproteobacteria bacterium]